MSGQSLTMRVFQRALVIQSRVVGALTLRELVLQYGHGAVPFGQVVMRPTAMIFGFYLVQKFGVNYNAGGFPLLLFTITGYMTWHVFLRCFANVSFRGIGGLLMFPHVTPLDYIISRMIGEFFLFSTMFIGMCVLAMIFEQAPPPADPLGVMVAFWGAAGLGVTFGMIAASISRYTSLLDDLFNGIRVIGSLLSGVYLLAADTPPEILQWLQWNPLFHCVEWLREAWWPQYKSPIASPLYVLTWIFFLFTVGLALERASRRLHPE